jgi:1-deoxy-D-xylulose-5-phosphate synthase
MVHRRSRERILTLLDKVRVPEDVRKLTREELRQLVKDVRDRHIDVVSHVGGHFGASLGVAELTVALHYVFDTPRDKLVWDTGHQAYIHKILTGRNEALPSIRKYEGLAPFLARWESEYDHFGAGHAATSISAALGTAMGRDLMGEDFNVVGIIGDGAMGCGLAYEALNNAGHSDRKLIVVLNDNDMSIAPNVGALNKYLTSMITHPLYNRVRDEIKSFLKKGPGSLRDVMRAGLLKAEGSMKGLLIPGMLFEELGFRYIGPLDGHDLDELVDTFENVRQMHGPVLVHCKTRKGKGFALAEENAYKWHAAGPFDKLSGEATKGSSGLPRYQKVFGKGLREMGAKYPEVCVITAGMPDGTSTDMFGEAFPDRFFDVGIAEGHGVTAAAGMATQGAKPVVCIYSTFLQRAFDNIVHDVALQDLPVVFCMDRGGIAGPDGPTHHGILDINFMLMIPGMTVTAPRDGAEMLALVRLGIEHDGPFSCRWPRDSVPAEVPPLDDIPGMEFGTWEVLRRGKDLALLAVGSMVGPSLDAARELSASGIDLTVVNCRFLKPYDRAVLEEVARGHGKILTLEEGAVINGFGSYMASEVQALNLEPAVEVHAMGVPDRFVQHGSREELLREIDLDTEGIVARVRRLLGDTVSPVAETA